MRSTTTTGRSTRSSSAHGLALPEVRRALARTSAATTRIFDKAGNVLGDLLVVGTRDLAWTFAERMWRNRDERDYRSVPMATLDKVATGFARALI